MLVYLRNLFLLSTPVARMLLTPRWVSKQKDMKYLSINISKTGVGVKHSVSRFLRSIELDLAYAKVSGITFQYILRSRSLWHALSSNMLKNERIFSSVISKLMSAFSLWLYNLVQPKIISLKNISRSLREIIVSSSVLNFGIFAYSTTLMSRFALMKTGGFG